MRGRYLFSLYTVFLLTYLVSCFDYFSGRWLTIYGASLRSRFPQGRADAPPRLLIGFIYSYLYVIYFIYKHDTIVASVAGDTFVTRAFRMFYLFLPAFRPPTTRPPLRLWLARCWAVRRLCTVAQIYTPARRAPSPKPSPAPSRCVLRTRSFFSCQYVFQARALVPLAPALHPHRHFRQALRRPPRTCGCSPQPAGVVYSSFCRLLSACVPAVLPSLLAGGHSPPKCAD